MNVHLSPVARRQFDEIIDGLIEVGASTADRFLDAWIVATDRLESFPNMGHHHPYAPQGLRVVNVGGYLLVYRVGLTRIDIVRIVRGERDLSEAMRE